MVKNSKKKLGDFAAETLANISKHFRLLHGQLQNVELQTIEELRESSLSPQMQLNEAMGRLNGYETLLKVSGRKGIKLRRIEVSIYIHISPTESTFNAAAWRWQGCTGAGGYMVEGSDHFDP